MKIFSTLGEIVVGYLRGAKKGGTPAALVTSSDLGPDRQALDVTIYDANGRRVDLTPVDIKIDSSKHGETNLVAADLLLNGRQILPGQQSEANSVPVVLAKDQTPGADRIVVGELRSAASSPIVIETGGCGSVGVSLQSIGATASITVISEGSVDGTGWVSLAGVLGVSGVNAVSWGMGANLTPTTFTIPCAGYSKVRIRVTAYTSGFALCIMRASAGSSTVSVATPLPIGTNSIGAVTMLSQLVDNAAFTDGSSSVLGAGFIVDETRASTQTPLSEGDIGAARISVNRQQISSIEDARVRGQRVSVNPSGEMAVSVDDLRRLAEIQSLRDEAAANQAMYASGLGGMNFGFEVR